MIDLHLQLTEEEGERLAIFARLMPYAGSPERAEVTLAAKITAALAEHADDPTLLYEDDDEITVVKREGGES